MFGDQDIVINGIVFTKKELVIIQAMLSGCSYKEIARRVFVVERTVQYHINNIMKKTNCNSKQELLKFFENAPQIEQTYLRSNFKLFFFMSGLLILGIVSGTLLYRRFAVQEEFSLVMDDYLDFKRGFLNRSSIEKQIRDSILRQKGLRMIVIIGGGGAGKTTLARELIKKSGSKIVWELNAESPDSLYNSLGDLCKHLANTNERRSELQNIKELKDIEAKRKWMVRFAADSLKNAKNWCILFDNVNNVHSIDQYLPHSQQVWGNGTVIMTSRNKNMKHVRWLSKEQVIDIGLLSNEEQEKLFCSILYEKQLQELSEETLQKVRKFLTNIPRMPLDVCSAAYYLKNTKISFEEYEKIMSNSYKDLEEMQKILLEDNVNYNRTRYGIISSIFDEMVKENKRNENLLLYMCLMDSQNISKNLMREQYGTVVADNFFYELQKNSLIVDSGDFFSIHRSSQRIGRDHMLSIMAKSKSNAAITNMVNFLTSQKVLARENLEKLAIHLETCLGKVKGLEHEEENVIKLLITLGDIYKTKTNRPLDALNCFRGALKRAKGLLKQDEIAGIELKIGEIYTAINANNEAMKYLKNSRKSLGSDLMKIARNYRLTGILNMRDRRFDNANKYFEKAIELLEQMEHDGSSKNEVERKIAISDIYSDMAFNYFMDGINRTNAEEAVVIMRKAIKVLAEAEVRSGDKFFEKAMSRKAIHQIKLAGILNALGKYHEALQLAQETENFLNTTKISNSDIAYVRGIIARERGLANLRLNFVEKAYYYFLDAKRIFAKSMTGDYLFKLKMHEVECLVRMNRLDEAFNVCAEMFAEKNRECTNYADLFFNTCYYHAAIIKYRQQEYEEAKHYFKIFFESMNVFCKGFISADVYKKLVASGAFETQFSGFKRYFENSLKVFEAIYWKDYEFTKYYVEENCKL